MFDIHNKYKAQGFVEALVTILIAGIATLVLMAVAIRTINSVVRNEVLDQLTQESVKGNELMSFVVDEYNYTDTTEHYFLPYEATIGGDLGKCFKLDGDLPSPIISTEISNCNYQSNSFQDAENTFDSKGIVPSDCISNETEVSSSAFSINEENGGIFRIVCIDPSSTDTVLVAKILTGNMTCSKISGERVTETFGNDNSCNIYEYTGIYNIRKTL